LSTRSAGRSRSPDDDDRHGERDRDDVVDVDVQRVPRDAPVRVDERADDDREQHDRDVDRRVTLSAASPNASPEGALAFDLAQSAVETRASVVGFVRDLVSLVRLAERPSLLLDVTVSSRDARTRLVSS
jgi:hypothetical protein